MKRKDTKLSTNQGWNLIACYNGENWCLHVENHVGQGASLDAAVNEHEVYCPRACREVGLKQSAIAIFDKWYDNYDHFCDEAEKMNA